MSANIGEGRYEEATNPLAEGYFDLLSGISKLSGFRELAKLVADSRTQLWYADDPNWRRVEELLVDLGFRKEDESCPSVG